MRNDFGLGYRAWRGGDAPEEISIPAGGRERTHVCWSVLCWLSWGGQIGAISSRASLLLFHSADKPLQCTHLARLWTKQEPSLLEAFPSSLNAFAVLRMHR